MTRPRSFKQVDVKRAVKGALAAGLSVGRVEVAPDGMIVVVAGEGAPADASNDFDRWKAETHARAAQGHQ
jgi:hypothetical protein